MLAQPDLTDSIPPLYNHVEPVFTEIVDKFNAAKSAGAALLELLNQQDMHGANTSLATLQHIIQDLTATVTAATAEPSAAPSSEPIQALLQRAHAPEMLENIDDTIQELSSLLASAEPSEPRQPAIQQCAQLCELQLIPFLRIASEACYFWGKINHDPQLKQQYYAQEFAFNHRNTLVESGEPLPYQATVVLIAYNHLDMTRRCLESVLQNTDFERLQCELVLVDHGSTDGTLEYFKSIPNARVVHLKRNVMLDMFTMLPMICRSPFLVTVCNDTVVTKDWLEILLNCMRSDPKIVLACPVTPNIGNNQDLLVSNDAECEAVVEMAKQHNQTNPLLWRERSQVFPAIGVFNLSLVNQIGFWDRAIYSFYFADDDFSLHARRAGFKQMLCEDVICYHQGNGTLSQHTKDLSTLGIELFKQKNGIAPKSHGTCFNDFFVQEVTKRRLAQLQAPNYQKPDSINILAIDCGIGDTPLQVKNVLKQAGITAQIYHLTTHPEFLADIRPFAAGAVCADSKILAQAIQACFPGVVFDYILTDSELPMSQITPALLTAVKSRLTADGDFAFFTPSPYYYKQVKVDVTVNPQLYLQREQELKKLIVTVYQYFKQGGMMPFQLNEITKDEVRQYLAPFFANMSDAEFNNFTTLRYCAVLQP